MYRHVGFAFNILALALFIPGILLPMFSMNMELAAFFSGASISSSLIDKELSIMGTVSELWQDQRFFVALLIFMFSVFIPVLKTAFVSISYFTQGRALERRLMGFVASIGKWSMADVFAVAVFLAILSTNHAQTSDSHEFSLFGFKMGLDMSTQTLSTAGDGFYFFTGYCLLSLLGTHLAMLGLARAKRQVSSVIISVD